VIEVAIYLVVVLLIGGLGVRLGMIVAGQIDRRTTPADAEPAPPPPTEESS
jgi:hypothetical protein